MFPGPQCLGLWLALSGGSAEPGGEPVMQDSTSLTRSGPVGAKDPPLIVYEIEFDLYGWPLEPMDRSVYWLETDQLPQVWRLDEQGGMLRLVEEDAGGRFVIRAYRCDENGVLGHEVVHVGVQIRPL